MDDWPVWGWIDQPTGSTELADWVEACQSSFQAGWSAVHRTLDEIVANDPPATTTL